MTDPINPPTPPEGAPLQVPVPVEETVLVEEVLVVDTVREIRPIIFLGEEAVMFEKDFRPINTIEFHDQVPVIVEVEVPKDLPAPASAASSLIQELTLENPDLVPQVEIAPAEKVSGVVVPVGPLTPTS